MLTEEEKAAARKATWFHPFTWGRLIDGEEYL